MWARRVEDLPARRNRAQSFSIIGRGYKGEDVLPLAFSQSKVCTALCLYVSGITDAFQNLQESTEACRRESDC